MDHSELIDIDINELGICEHCGKIIFLSVHLRTQGMNSDWICFHKGCGGKIGHKSFGFNQAEKGAKKERWVGKDAEWVDEKPTSDFEILGRYYVWTVSPTSFM